MPASTPSIVREPAPAARRSFIGAYAGLLGGRLAARRAQSLKRQGNGMAAQDATYRGLMRQLARTDFGRRAGLFPNLDYRDFRRRIELRTYEEFAPYVQRMLRGESDVLCPGRCAHFAVSSGTTAGASKWLPVPATMLAHFRAAGLDAMLFYAHRAGRSSVFRGRHLFLGGSTALVPIPGAAPPIYSGDLSGITALNLPWWAERHFYEPGIEIAQMTDWPAKLAAIARRTLRADLTLMAGIPSWLLVFAETMRAHAAQELGRSPATLRELWPHLECVVHGGVPVAPFSAELQAVIGPGVALHEVYPSSEGFIAAQDSEPEAGLRLLADRGLFFEFLPAADYYPDGDPGAAGMRAVPLEGVKPGEDYVLMLTTPAGLVRYVIGDVVRFVTACPPRLVYVGRTRLQLSAFGEHVIEKELTDSLAVVCHRAGMAVAGFHVAPLFPDPASDRPRGCHEWWIELRPAGGRPGATIAVFAIELDRELAARNDDYAAKRAGQGLAAPAVRFVRPGLFEHWLKQHGKWGGQGKMPRCRSDRIIADELAGLR